MPTRILFKQELESLNRDVLTMGDMTAKTLRLSLKALVNQDKELAKSIVDGDDAIDQMQYDIEDKCISLIARQQPIASDLRLVFTADKISTDLERIADLAGGIAKATIALADEHYMKALIDIPRMGDIAATMIRDSLDAYVRKDIELAAAVIERDAEVDALYVQLQREFISYASENPKNIFQIMQFQLVSRFLERIADHVKNVCEWIIFNATGKRVD